VAGAQFLGITEPAPSLVRGDPHPVGQHVGQRGATQCGGAGLGHQPGGQPLFERGQRPRHGLDAVQLGQQFGRGQPVSGCGLRGGQPGDDHVDRGDQGGAVLEHAFDYARGIRQNAPHTVTETTLA
jgi:hypothetical protein